MVKSTLFAHFWVLTTTVLTFGQNDSFPLNSKSKCHYNLTQHFETTVVVKNFGHFWPLNLVRSAVFVHFWPRNFRPKFLVRNALFVHFWPRLFWPFGQKCSGQKSRESLLLLLAVVTDSKRQFRYCLIELAILLTHLMKEYFNSFDDIQFFSYIFINISRYIDSNAKRNTLLDSEFYAQQVDIIFGPSICVFKSPFLRHFSQLREKYAFKLKIKYIMLISSLSPIWWCTYIWLFLKKTTPLYSTYLFKIFFLLLTLSTAFLQKASGPGKNQI